MTAKRIREGTFTYNWGNYGQCNCGLLTRTIMGKSLEDMHSMLAAHAPIIKKGDWAMRADQYCSVTGIPNNKIFKNLILAGLHFEDFRHLERLSDPVIAQRAGSWTDTKVIRRWLRKDVLIKVEVPIRYNHHNCVIGYMEAWATMIEEFHAAQQPTEAALEATELRPLVKL